MTGLNTQRIPINHRGICTYICIYVSWKNISLWMRVWKRFLHSHCCLPPTPSNNGFALSNSFIDMHLPVCVSGVLKWTQSTTGLLILPNQTGHVTPLVAVKSSLRFFYESWLTLLLHSYEEFIHTIRVATWQIWNTNSIICSHSPHTCMKLIFSRIKRRPSNDFNSIYKSMQFGILKSNVNVLS